MLPHLVATRYLVPLREGGSLPAVVETWEHGSFVVKFRGAGQGPKALIAEALAAGIGRALGLPVPEPALIELASGFGREEPDPEIQDLLRGSVGTNFGLRYLAGALPFDPAVERQVDPALAASIVWFDAFITNVDRTVRNTNVLVWQGQLWLIDHGASLYFQHSWDGWRDRIQSPFTMIKDHVLLGQAGDLRTADAALRPRLTASILAEVVATLPDDWLGDEAEFPDHAAHRAAYLTYLTERLNGPRPWLQEALTAQQRGPARLTIRTTHRVE